MMLRWPGVTPPFALLRHQTYSTSPITKPAVNKSHTFASVLTPLVRHLPSYLDELR